MQGKLTTAEAARTVRIAWVTLERWIAAGKVRAPELTIRRGRAVRLWSPSDLKRLRQARKLLYHQGGGRPTKEKQQA